MFAPPVRFLKAPVQGSAKCSESEERRVKSIRPLCHSTKIYYVLAKRRLNLIKFLLMKRTTFPQLILCNEFSRSLKLQWENILLCLQEEQSLRISEQIIWSRVYDWREQKDKIVVTRERSFSEIPGRRTVTFKKSKPVNIVDQVVSYSAIVLCLNLIKLLVLTNS